MKEQGLSKVSLNTNGERLANRQYDLLAVFLKRTKSPVVWWLETVHSRLMHFQSRTHDAPLQWLQRRCFLWRAARFMRLPPDNFILK